MECSSCPGEDRELLIIVVIGALFVLVKMSNCGGLVVFDLFFAIPFWENFGGF